MQTLGIDLGGTYVRAAVVEADGTILGSSKQALTERTPEAVVAAIALAKRAAEAEAPGARVERCGVGAAGQLEGDSGVILVAPNLGWRNVPFGALLAEKLGQSVRVVNDLSAAAWGEHEAGAAQGAPDVLTVFVGTGVGSAIIANGALVQGARGVAGELGHVKVVPNGRLCGCGEKGCLEAYTGGHHLIELMKEALAAGKAPLLAKAVGEGTPNPAQLEAAAEAGDVDARAIYDQALRFLALCLGNQVTMLNPGRLILGGGVLAHAPHLRQRLEGALLAVASVASRTGLEVRTAALGDDSGLIGAALLA
jgi:glucokinase